MPDLFGFKNYNDCVESNTPTFTNIQLNLCKMDPRGGCLDEVCLPLVSGGAAGICCAEGQIVFNGNCIDCGMSAGSCPGELLLDPETCECVCGISKICPSPQVFNTATCDCECSTLRSCDGALVFDPSTCRCECPSPQTCGPLHILSPATCECECKSLQTCAPPKVFDHSTCRCECPSPQTCVPPKVFSPATCKCECPPQTCAPPKVFDPSTCRCECPSPQTCGPPYTYFNPATCECECPPQTCAPPNVLNPATCECSPCLEGEQRCGEICCNASSNCCNDEEGGCCPSFAPVCCDPAFGGGCCPSYAPVCCFDLAGEPLCCEFSALRTVTIQSGDTLSGIAQKLGTTVEQLARLNNIRDPDRIVAGDTLLVESTAAGQGGQISHSRVVRRGG